MKRKLDADDRPVPSSNGSGSKSDVNFASFGLDARLLQALVKQGFSAPTAVQAKVIPLALGGERYSRYASSGTNENALL